MYGPLDQMVAPVRPSPPGSVKVGWSSGFGTALKPSVVVKLKSGRGWFSLKVIVLPLQLTALSYRSWPFLLKGPPYCDVPSELVGMSRYWVAYVGPPAFRPASALA